MQNNCLQQDQIECLNAFPLAQAYVPYQQFTDPVSPEEGLKMGTIWAALYRPYRRESK